MPEATAAARELIVARAHATTPEGQRLFVEIGDRILREAIDGEEPGSLADGATIIRRFMELVCALARVGASTARLAAGLVVELDPSLEPGEALDRVLGAVGLVYSEQEAAGT